MKITVYIFIALLLTSQSMFAAFNQLDLGKTSSPLADDPQKRKVFQNKALSRKDVPGVVGIGTGDMVTESYELGLALNPTVYEKRPSYYFQPSFSHVIRHLMVSKLPSDCNAAQEAKDDPELYKLMLKSGHSLPDTLGLRDVIHVNNTAIDAIEEGDLPTTALLYLAARERALFGVNTTSTWAILAPFTLLVTLPIAIHEGRLLHSWKSLEKSLGKYLADHVPTKSLKKIERASGITGSNRRLLIDAVGDLGFPKDDIATKIDNLTIQLTEEEQNNAIRKTRSAAAAHH